MMTKLHFLARMYLGKAQGLLKRFKVVKPQNLTRYAGRPVLNMEEGNAQIKRMMESGQPFAAVRFGSSELQATVDAWGMNLGAVREFRPQVFISLERNAGFFPPTHPQIKRYGELMRASAAEVDMFAVWYMPMEAAVIRDFAPKAILSQPRGFEPYYAAQPWTQALANKRVLVIHPFERSIRSQYARRDDLFENLRVLPQFELLTLKAVQSAAYAEKLFPTWFNALDFMTTEAMKIDFDVAIIGCGAYGFPLAVRLKQAGKQAVHMGGATQILFGIKGARWDAHPVISKLYNDAWVRPLPEETPARAAVVEGGCYW